MADGAITVNENALQLATKVFEDLTAAGGTVSDDQLWSFVSSEVDWDAARLPQNKDALGHALSGVLALLDRLEATRRTLNDLSDSFERKASTVKTELYPSFLHYGVLAAPDEVLERIFKIFVHELEHKTETDAALVLSHVSSRFRSISLRCPSLWSHLSSRMTKSQISNHMKRAKASPLSAIVDVSVPEEKLEHFSTLIEKHSSRWELIKFVGHNMRTSYDPDETLRELHLPNLECFDSRIIFDEEALGEWTVPKLKCVRLLETVPQSESNLFGLSTIERVIFSSFHEGYDTEHEPLIDFLLSLPNLTYLDLEYETGGSEEDRGVCEDDDLGELPRLKYLKLKTSAPKVFSAMLDQLRMPVLEKLDITINDEVDKEYGNYYTPRHWMRTFPSRPCPSVKYLRLFFKNTGREELYLHTLLTTFSELEHLELDNPVNQPSMFEGSYSKELPSMPPLRSVTMQAPPETFLENFIRAMRDSGRWEKLERFCFKPTGQITRTHAEKLLTKRKTEWFE